MQSDLKFGRSMSVAGVVATAGVLLIAVSASADGQGEDNSARPNVVPASNITIEDEFADLPASYT
ncbi:MAG: hypothetical protein VYC34_12785, partial [Planctomycetota bacterium]|nr:hypothetical protein [Planctomycetota bacterium]